MNINASIGEVVDKVTILSIKLEKFKDQAKRLNVQKEFDILSIEMEKSGISLDSEEFKSLREVNITLWHIEDHIRIKESKQEFDAEFIKLARSVYFENDVRAERKKDINIKFGSDLIEEKEYVEYKK